MLILFYCWFLFHCKLKFYACTYKNASSSRIFCPQTPHGSFAPRPHWGTSVSKTFYRTRRHGFYGWLATLQNIRPDLRPKRAAAVNCGNVSNDRWFLSAKISRAFWVLRLRLNCKVTDDSCRQFVRKVVPEERFYGDRRHDRTNNTETTLVSKK